MIPGEGLGCSLDLFGRDVSLGSHNSGPMSDQNVSKNYTHFQTCPFVATFVLCFLFKTDANLFKKEMI